MGMIILTIIGSIIIGYGLGCINMSYILSSCKGFDIRKYGSGNAGASNIVIVIGKRAGLFVALFDIFKAAIAVLLASLIFRNAVIEDISYAGCIAGAATIIGHICPFYMNFRGGKGLAALGGTILALDYRHFLILLMIAVVIAVVTDYICFVPIVMAFVFPIWLGYMHSTWIPTAILFIASMFIWYRHIENIQRIKAGTELKFHFLWNRKSESERFGIADDGKAVFEHELDKNM